MKITMLTVGTQGEVRPCLALGVGLQTAGLVPLFILLVLGLGLLGCRSDMLPTQLAPPAIDSARPERAPAPVVASQSTTIPDPTPTLLPTRSSPGPGPVPGITSELPSLEPTLISHGDRALPYIALTFDACQSPTRPAGYDEAVINILTETRTPATLFLGGLWMQHHPAQTRVLAANPLFELGNHAWSHPDFAQLSPAEMSAEIRRTQRLMAELTGRQPTLFRFPFGWHTEEALTVVGQHGLQAIQWDVLTGDPDPRISARAIVDEVTTEAQNGSIVIMHMNTWGWHTAEALPIVIKQLRAKGYTFVTVSQLLELASHPASHR